MFSKTKTKVAMRIGQIRGRLSRFWASHAVAWRIRGEILARRIRTRARSASVTVAAVAIAAMTLLVPSFRDSANAFDGIDAVLSQIGATYGTILALVLTLSIVPVQRAAEVWSPSIMRLYRRDEATYWTFVCLGVFCAASFFLGSVHPGVETSTVLATSLVALGVSLDVLRWYHGHICRLLDPIQAVSRALKEGKNSVDAADALVANLAEKQLRLSPLNQRTPAHKARIEANIFQKIPGFPSSITSWINDLAEVAVKAIARNEKLLTRASVAAIAHLVTHYFSARQRNVTVTPDIGTFFATASNTDSVSNPAYDALSEVARAAIAQSDEGAAIRVVEAYSAIAAHTLTLEASPFGHREALSFAPIHYALLCVREAQAKGLNEVAFQSAGILARVSQGAPQNLTTVHRQIVDGLTEISTYFYSKTNFGLAEVVVGHQVSILGRSLQREDADFGELLEYILGQLATLAPLALANEARAGRLSTTRPLGAAYDLTNQNAIGYLFARTAQNPAGIDPRREWLNPHRNLIEIAQTIYRHLRTVAERNEFGESFLLWEIDRTIKEISQVIAAVVDNPIRHDRDDADELIGKLRWMISFYWVAFRGKRTISEHRATDCCESLATIGLQFFKRQYPDVLRDCISNIRSIMESFCEIEENPNPYAIGEMLACLSGIRMAVVGRQQLVQAVDEALSKPRALSDEQWQEAQAAIQLRREQLEEDLAEPNYRAAPDEGFTQTLRELLDERGRGEDGEPNE